MRHVTILSLICLCATLVPLAAEEQESVLMQQILAARRYETGLTLDGLSGLMITSSPEALIRGDWFVGASAFIDPTDDDVKVADFGFNLATAFGLLDDVWGPFKSVEIAASVPLYGTEVASDAEVNMGDMVISGKLQWIELDPMTPDLPAVTFVGSAILPTGDDGYTTIDQGGIEAGMVLGTRVPDSSNMVDFRVFIELRVAYYDIIAGGQDTFYKGNLGISFPLAEVPDAYLLLEFGQTWETDNAMDSSVYAVSIRSQSVDRNLSVGFTMRTYVDQDADKRQVFAMYDIKF